jgi:hypothetical protein
MSVYVCVECGKPIEQVRFVEIVGYVDHRRNGEFTQLTGGLIYCTKCIGEKLGSFVLDSLNEIEKSSKWVVLDE